MIHNDDIPDIPLTPIERELKSPTRRRHRHPNHMETHPLDARKERGRNIWNARKGKKSKGKKYDGRTFSKNAVVARAKVREALESFYKEVKLPELKQALEISNDPRYDMLLAALNNPRMNGCSFSTLCRKCRMSIQDVVEVWRNHLKTQGIVRMMGHMPDIMEDVAIDSKSRTVTCDMCQGKGVLHDKKVNNIDKPICPECHGDGSVRLMGDKDARLLAFETVGLKKGGGIGQVNVLNVNKGGVPSMEDQIASIDKVFDAEYETVTEKGAGNGATGNGVDGSQAAVEGVEPESGGTGVQGETFSDDSVDSPLDPTDYST